jgi:dienelactone hydrolase
MQSAKAPGRLDTYRRVLQLQQKAFALKDPRLSRVEIPYEGTTLPAYFSAAPAADSGPVPVMIMWNGLDSTKEHMYSSAHWDELAARGISALMVDCPGSGEALRLHCRGRRHRAYRAGPPAPRQHVHRGLGRRYIRRAERQPALIT